MCVSPSLSLSLSPFLSLPPPLSLSSSLCVFVAERNPTPGRRHQERSGAGPGMGAVCGADQRGPGTAPIAGGGPVLQNPDSLMGNVLRELAGTGGS